jgi:hypothetical protein
VRLDPVLRSSVRPSRTAAPSANRPCGLDAHVMADEQAVVLAREPVDGVASGTAYVSSGGG